MRVALAKEESVVGGAKVKVDGEESEQTGEMTALETSGIERLAFGGLARKRGRKNRSGASER